MPLALCVIAYHVTQIIGFGALAVAHCVTQAIGFGALAVVDSILLALVRPLVVCIDLATPFVTATTRQVAIWSPPLRAWSTPSTTAQTG